MRRTGAGGTETAIWLDRIYIASSKIFRFFRAIAKSEKGSEPPRQP
jgi:hypothetical protein